MTLRRGVIVALLALVAAAAIALLVFATVREAPDSNSYALMADAWLHGRFDVDRCFDTDCALFQGKTYVIFPPAPAVIALPFVALFGTGFRFFMPLSLAAFAGIGYLWWRMAKVVTKGDTDFSALIVLVTLFATPLYFVMARADSVWFFAQLWGFLFATAAIYCALIRRDVFWAGIFIGIAFLCRQMTLLYVPLLYVMALGPDTPLFRIDRAALLRVARLAIGPLLAVIVYLVYNQLRFGSPLETGYSFIFPPGAELTGGGAVLPARMRDIGAFSPDYFLFNFIYMFLAGPHVEFTGPYLTQLAGFDIYGASLFLVTPVLLWVFLAPWNRLFLFGALTAGLILVLTLFYHSNGSAQFSAQRYALDWLPVLLVLLAGGTKRELAGPFAILTLYAMSVTFSMVALAGYFALIAK